MKTRSFGTTGVVVSEVGLGTWQLGGGDWGEVQEEQAQATLHAAADAGVTLFDTADIYGGGESERRIGRFLRARDDRDELRVATKFGRASEPGGAANLGYEAMRKHAEGSLSRLGVSKLWLTQGHCLDDEVLRRGTVFDNLRRLKRDGLVEHFGMSVESVAQAKLCLEVDDLSSLQVIFNVFRQKLVDELFDDAQRRGVALIVRLPLASGLLGGKLTRDHAFAASDHRVYNRDGHAFNVGETFAGVPFETGLELVEQLRPRAEQDCAAAGGGTMAQWALRYCLDFPAVTTVIPGARNVSQVNANVRASELPRLSDQSHAWLREFYATNVAANIRGVY